MIVFITGASAGFGAAMTKRFADEGNLVVASGRREDRLQQLAKDFDQRVVPLVLDVTDRDAVTNAIQQLPPAFQKIDVLINNAGLALGLEKAPEADLDNWDKMVDTNIKGLMYMTHALLPGMVARNKGHIINLGSVAGTWPNPGTNVYGATKAFVRQFSHNLRTDLLGTKIRVTDIEPGLCGGTEFSQVRFGGDEAKAASIYEGTEPLTAEDIADTAYWIASRPPHVNVNTIEIMPVCQSLAGYAIHREK